MNTTYTTYESCNDYEVMVTKTVERLTTSYEVTGATYHDVMGWYKMLSAECQPLEFDVKCCHHQQLLDGSWKLSAMHFNKR